MKTYMTDRAIPRRTWYTPYHQDMDDLSYRKRRSRYGKHNIFYKVSVSLFIILMVCAWFATSLYMGFAMLGTMIFLSLKKS